MFEPSAYPNLRNYKLTTTNFFDYLTLVEWIKIHKTLFYSILEDKQKLIIHIIISIWLLDEFNHLVLPDNILLEQW